MNTLRKCLVFFGRQRLRFMSREHVFTRIYQKNHWKHTESRSGSGSTLAATETLRKVLPEIVSEHGIKSILDIPCGDFNWMSQLDFGTATYLGADIVPALVEGNQARFGSNRRQFKVLDLVKDPLPTVDLVICRDVFIHLSLVEVATSLRNIKRSGSKLLLASTYPGVSKNREGITGSWRHVNLAAPPFSLPAPLRLIQEEPLTQPTAKAAGLWHVSTLPSEGNFSRFLRRSPLSRG